MSEKIWSATDRGDLVDGGVVTRKKTSIVRTAKGYDAVLADVVALIDAGRRAVVRSSNAIMTMTYWAVGQRIVEEEQQGEARADYGEVLVSRLAVDLTARFGRGFGQRNVFNMRAFYLSHRDTILQTASAKSRSGPVRQKFQTLSGESVRLDELARLAGQFSLPWSCYVRLLSVEARRRVTSTKERRCAAVGPFASSIGRSVASSTNGPRSRRIR
jgi:hypothetical protein